MRRAAASRPRAAHLAWLHEARRQRVAVRPGKPREGRACRRRASWGRRSCRTCTAWHGCRRRSPSPRRWLRRHACVSASATSLLRDGGALAMAASAQRLNLAFHAVACSHLRSRTSSWRGCTALGSGRGGNVRSATRGLAPREHHSPAVAVAVLVVRLAAAALAGLGHHRRAAWRRGVSQHTPHTPKPADRGAHLRTGWPWRGEPA